MARTELHTQVVRWIKQYIKIGTPATGIPVIRAQRNGPRPKLPEADEDAQLFAVIDLTNLSPKGFASKTVTNTTTNETAYSYIGTATLGIEFFGNEAIGQLETLRNTHEHELVSSYLDSAGASILDPGSVLDLTALKDSRFEERARLELIFHVSFTSSEVVNWIEKVEINDKTISLGG